MVDTQLMNAVPSVLWDISFKNCRLLPALLHSRLQDLVTRWETKMFNITSIQERWQSYLWKTFYRSHTPERYSQDTIRDHLNPISWNIKQLCGCPVDKFRTK